MTDGQRDGKSKATREKEERLKRALRANLRRRKQAAKAAEDRGHAPPEATAHPPPAGRK
jgi:hypothetical protein